jgi:hypothetical protein
LSATKTPLVVNTVAKQDLLNKNNFASTPTAMNTAEKQLRNKDLGPLMPPPNLGPEPQVSILLSN